MFNSNASSAAGGANYIEEVFSTWLYTGTGVAQTITNNIDISTKGGAVWIKGRNAAEPHVLVDSARGASNALRPNSTAASINDAGRVSAFTTSGFTVRTDGETNGSGTTYASWTFREQPKFFDVVTYTGTGSNRTIAHSLGSVPGSIIVKRTDTTADWAVYHRSLANTQYLVLNDTAAAATGATWWNSTTPTSAVFSVGTNATVNASGGTYVAYIFAHDAAGFGLAGTDNVISCGSYTCVAYPGNVAVTLGYEPQLVMVKNATQASNWVIYDNMRGMPGTVPPNPVTLAPDSSAAENGVTGDAPGISPTATGFIARAGLTAVSGSAGDNVIYIAIRRGPMKVPTDATKVFTPIAKTGDGSTTTVTNVGFPADLFMFKWRGLPYSWKQQDRLRGFVRQISSDNTNADSNSGTYTFGTVNNTGYTYGANASSGAGELNFPAITSSVLAFGRAPSFMDEVCYTGNGVSIVQNVSHNLGVVPTLMIVKGRDSTSAGEWRVYDVFDGADNYMALNTTAATASGYGAYWGNSTTPTSSVFSVSSSNNISAGTYVAYLFATCDGVSKVGSYTGTGTTQTINCGFTAGARFVLIKRTDSTGDWYVWDTARGIVPGNDPYLLLNSTAAEVTSTDYVDTAATGFELSSTAPAALNASGGTYIFLAIA